jgi:murein DD-endopeptidase MepM/ murein hydrolase activator NlpD
MILPGRKYELDHGTLEFRQVKLAGKRLLGRLFFWFFISLMSAGVYALFVGHFLGSPKMSLLNNQLEEEKLRYFLLQKEMAHYAEIVAGLRISDEVRYRPLLELSPISQVQRNAAAGGVDRYAELSGYRNSGLMINVLSSLDELKRQAYIQSRSFEEIRSATDEWVIEMEHMPWIRPVNASIPLGEGVRFRDSHPVTGDSRMHWGQDFRAPEGTEVFATGAGTVVDAGWSSGGHGNRVIIDHGYGFRTVYGHLSAIQVSVGKKVKRFELIGISGNTGISTGPHLHYEVILSGRYAVPSNYFSDDLSADEYNEMIDLFSSKRR